MIYREMTYRAFNHKKRRIRIKYLNRLLRIERDENKFVWISRWEHERNK